MNELFWRWLVAKPAVVLMGILAAVLLASSQLDQIKLDASSDSLLLQGDPDLAYFREVSSHYAANEFLVLTWSPEGPLLHPDSLEPLAAMVDELQAVPGVVSVTSLLDVPLLESPPLSLTDLARADALPTLANPEVDRNLALAELTTSPVYKNLLVGEAGDVTAIQVSLETNSELQQLLQEREELRGLAANASLDESDARRLVEVEARYDSGLAQETELRRALVVPALRANFCGWCAHDCGGYAGFC